MAKRGRYSNKTKDQADLFIEMMDGSVDDVHKYNLFNIVRNTESTTEKTLTMLENHFGLI